MSITACPHEEYIDKGNKRPVVGNDERFFPIINRFTGLPDYPKIISYNSKWMYKTVEFANTKAVCPAENLTAKEVRQFQQTAKIVTASLEQLDYAWVDMRLKMVRHMCLS
jgi:hypothetical protein